MRDPEVLTEHRGAAELIRVYAKTILDRRPFNNSKP